MSERIGDQVSALVFDVFGTVVDWRTGVAEQVAAIASERGVQLDPPSFADEWRARYGPSTERVRTGDRAWAYLDTLHRESLDGLLEAHGVASSFDEDTRCRLVHAWHRLPAWEDTVPGLTRLRTRYVLATLSNGGVALLTHLAKAAALPFDCILSAELAHTYKPHPAVYRMAARLLDLEPGRVMMVAAHANDLEAAASVGLRTAFVERPDELGPGLVPDRIGEVACDVAAGSLTELADSLDC
ncbi:MAG TPA: haloacid dehalogenase type II [Candidatus Dormibacteraeota bacterium]|jgi:2-haloacid dehalogenase|nr:haloacid dehalogenase type II [Candidatus Dormibacteraeota bacterium]